MLAAFLASGCAKTAESNFKTVVLPKDPIVYECTAPPGQVPKPSAREYTGDETAREYNKLSKFTKSMRGDYVRCQTWAKGQR